MADKTCKMKDKLFLGRPQESCHRCRERRIQCGRERPGCKRCREESHDCPGYRPRISLDFKDESLLAAKKVQARKRKQVRKENATGLGSTTALAIRTEDKRYVNPPRWHIPASRDQYYFPIPIMEVALSCFTTKCIHGSFLGRLHPLYNDLRPDSPLSIVLNASALASLAIDSRQPRIMTLAHWQYSQAVRQTKQALSNPVEYLTDETLASVFLLGLFEVISFDEETVQASWNAHLSGALEIVRLRGIQQLNTNVGLELYVAVLLGFRTICVKRQTKLPQWVIDFECQASELLNTHPTYHLRHIFDSFSDIQQREPMGMSSAAEMIKQCLELDEVIASAYAQVLIEGVAGIITAETQEILKTRQLNALRTIRIQLNCWIQQYITKLGPAAQTTNSEDNEQLYSKAHEMMKILAVEILESARKFLIPPVTMSSQFMIFYLYSLVQQPLIPDQLKTQARDSIRVIGTEGRIPEALRATERLDRQDRQRDTQSYTDGLNIVRN